MKTKSFDLKKLKLALELALWNTELQDFIKIGGTKFQFDSDNQIYVEQYDYSVEYRKLAEEIIDQMFNYPEDDDPETLGGKTLIDVLLP
jgi:hypothetical protein